MNEMVRDRVVMGSGNGPMQERLMRESNLTLKKATDLCRVIEIAKIQHQEMGDKNIVLAIQEEVKKLHKWTKFSKRQEHRKPFKQESSNGRINEKNKSSINTIYKCKKCNNKHGPRKCPAFGKTYNICKGLNHYAIGCKNNKNVPQITEFNVDNTNDFCGVFKIETITKVHNVNKAW